MAAGPPRGPDLPDPGVSRRATRWRMCCAPPLPAMFRMKDEMDAPDRADGGGRRVRRATLRRYGELTARFEGLGGYDTDTAVNKVANGLSIPDGDAHSGSSTSLSGGEKTRVNLGRLILEDTDILLLDEPTNHLDLQATEWLEEYLRTFRGTVVDHLATTAIFWTAPSPASSRCWTARRSFTAGITASTPWRRSAAIRSA